MKATLIRVAGGALFTTLLLVALMLAFPGRRATFVGAYELVIGAIAVGALLGSLRTLRPEPWARSPFDRGRDKPAGPASIDQLTRIDRLVVLGCSSAFDLHYRLRPLLRELTAERLHASHGVDLDRQPDRARPLLGDELWSVVRADRQLDHRYGPGLPTPELADIVERLEAL
jgi:hypothetical protein